MEVLCSVELQVTLEVCNGRRQNTEHRIQETEYIRKGDTMPYGMELILDLHQCNTRTFNKISIEKYLVDLCELIDMEREDLHFWDDADYPEPPKRNPKTYGCSAVQFIITSSIVIHALPLCRAIYINLFSCKAFDPNVVADYTEEFFCGVVAGNHFLQRM